MLTRRSFLSSSAALAVASHTPVLAADKPPVRIGCLQPMTGFASAYGLLYNAALTLAAKDINAAGGINGSPLELKVEDDQLAAPQSVLLFRKHVAEGAMIVLGPISGTSWENVAPIATAMRCPAINSNALKPGISRPPYAVRIHPPDDTMIPEGIAEFQKALPQVRRVVVAGDLQEASGTAGVEEFTKALKARGLELLDTVGYQTRTTDFSPAVIKIRGLNPDALFVSSLGPTSLGLVKELETQGFDKPILINALVWAGGAFIHAVGSAGRRLYSIGFATQEMNQGNPRHDQFAERYLKFAAETTNLPQPVNVCNAGLTYDTVMLVAKLMRDNKIDGTTDVVKAREILKDALAALKEWDGIHTIRMRPSGDGHIQSHLLKANVEAKRWEFALPMQDRVQQAAAVK
jgi:branched-chain amino acid transport system substrate-binding protein